MNLHFPKSRQAYSCYMFVMGILATAILMGILYRIFLDRSVPEDDLIDFNEYTAEAPIQADSRQVEAELSINKTDRVHQPGGEDAIDPGSFSIKNYRDIKAERFLCMDSSYEEIFRNDTIREIRLPEEEHPYALFLVEENGFITAYLGDQTDIFEYTQIPLDSFPPQQQSMLSDGLYMETFEDYYDFLESYTS